MKTANYSEFTDSQLPALNLLRKLGWNYISPEDTITERGGILSNVILEEILSRQLKKINEFEYKGGKFKFSEGNIHSAIHALKNVPDEGLLRTSEKIYDLLTLGKSFEESIQGDKKSFTIKYIDWENLHNNVFHITDEFEVVGLSKPRRPDIVLFINGIPFAVLENKRRDKNQSLDEAISQHIRNQGKAEGIPRLFHFAQILLAVQPNEVKYSVIDTKPRFWNKWQEESNIEKEVLSIIQSTRNGVQAENRLATEQDKILFCLARPDRLMEFSYNFTLYDAGEKKIARYQQYFTVKNTLERIKEFEPSENGDNAREGRARKGGVIWHTQGSGKSLTMVMLAKYISIDKNISNPRVIIVTDRIDLDKQIYTTFHHCGKTPERAKSGNHLTELIDDAGIEVITTVIDKFESALNRRDFKNESNNIFVLVDESHRGQYGKTHTKMRRVLPNACYLGFTGTPLMQDEKSTARKFGGFIYPIYSINTAVKDGAVVPLLYEGRSAKLTVNQQQIDKGFDRLSEPLTTYQSALLKRKGSSITEIYKSQQVIEEIAYDVSKHFCENWKGTGFKAMLAVPLRSTAIMYQKYFEEQTNPDLRINTRVVISLSDTRENHDEPEEEPNDDVQRFWKKINERYGNPENYEDSVIGKFKSEEDEVELLIVVGKLLTGFDAPRATILYLAKELQGHNLLQAIARVNRLFEGKDFGYIISYLPLLGNLDKALTEYQALEGFDESDLVGTVTNITEEVKKLPQRYSDLLDVFKEVSDKRDIEALERFLAPKNIRYLFIEKLTAFARNLQLALSSDETYKIFSDERINLYIKELKFYQSLKASVSVRYADKISYKEYEARVRKLLDTYVGAEGTEKVTQPINIFDEELFKKEVERVTGSVASKADIIAYQMKKTISERMEEDPVFYKKFSELINDAIKDFHDKRLSEAQYLANIISIRSNFIQGNADGTPATLNGNPEGRAFYGIVKEKLLSGNNTTSPDINNKLAEVGIGLSEIVSKLVIRDWKRNEDVQKQMKNEMEDYLLSKRNAIGISISYEQIDAILDDVLKVAKNVY